MSIATRTLIVFSHLRWGFIHQRPQHLLSRLAAHYRILFIEEPVFAEAPARLDAVSVAANVEVIAPRTPVDTSGFDDEQLVVVRPLLKEFLRDRGIEDYVVWFYNPMALPLLSQLDPRAVVYDCMDDFSPARGSSELMTQREALLLKTANLVLTSGPALYEAKRSSNTNVQCLPSAVDAAHYAPANLKPSSVEADAVLRLQGDIDKPRLGFFGVIDERVDLKLLAALADADARWQVVMVGPVLNIDPARLPRRPNIHWLGMQPYSLLPQLVAGWDVCLMPFAMNDSTRYISPTKTLEYMAAEKPVVSTALPDVVSLYGDVVRVAGTRSGFVEQCREALGENGRHRALRVMEMTQCVARFSWDKAAATVLELIETELEKALVGPVRLVEQTRPPIERHRKPWSADGVVSAAASSLSAHAARIAAMAAADAALKAQKAA